MRAPRHVRGQAALELALVLPLMAAMVWAGSYFAELARVKLKVQEASRYVAWEMTRHGLGDYQSAPEARFQSARAQVLREAVARYSDLDSVATSPRRSGALAVGPLDVTLTHRPAPPMDAAVALGAGPRPGTTFDPAIIRAAQGPVGRVLERWGFDLKGEVQAEVSVAITSELPGWSEPRRLRSRHTLLASDWHLRDGADARMTLDRSRGGPRAGVRHDGTQHLLHRQVARMTFLGLAPSAREGHGLDEVASRFGFDLPDPFGTFVVSHNYGLTPEDRSLRACSTGARGDRKHPAQDGLNNIEKYALIDDPHRRCFDTTPFRDRQSYADSQYVAIFRARGPYFMGCQAAMADDPSEPELSAWAHADAHDRPVACEGPR